MVLNVYRGRSAQSKRLRRGSMLVAVLGMTPITWAGTLTLNVNAPLHPVPAKGIGLGSAVYANQWGNSALPSRLAEAGIQTLRYPGGSYADFYHFSNNTAPGGYVAGNSGFGNFAKVISQAGATGMVTVDYGSSFGGTTGGTPQEAAAWVAYANGTPGDAHVIGSDVEGTDWKTTGFWASLRASSKLAVDDGYNFLRIAKTAPIGISKWEIGNEVFGDGYYASWTWETNKRSALTGSARVGVAALGPAQYGQDVVAFSAAMKAVDPSVKIGIPLVTNSVANTSNPATNWNRNVLLNCGSVFDFGIYHYYTNQGTNPATEDALLMSAPATGIPTFINKLRADIQTYTGRTNVDLDMTEFGYMGNVTSDRITALFAADCYGLGLTQGLSSVHWLEMSKSSFVGDSASLTRGSAFYAIEATSKFASVGGNFVSITSSLSTLHAYAASNGPTALSLMLINEDLANPATSTMTLPSGFLPASATLYLTDGTTFTTSSIAFSGGSSITLTIPAGSIATYVLQPLSAVPEPHSTGLFALGMALACSRRFRRTGIGL